MMANELTTNLRVQDMRSQFEDTRRQIADLQQRSTEPKERLAGLDRRLALLTNAQRAISVKLIRIVDGESHATEATIVSHLRPDDTVEVEVIGLIPRVDR
jgi:septal ring factor EnvC (AmiA/AmiB activator)